MLGPRLLLLLAPLLFMASGSSSSQVRTTTTRTVVAFDTVTETLVAINGIIQKVIVKVDNGNGHTWDTTTVLVTGERILTIVPSTRTMCATIYVYGDVTLSTETSLMPPSTVAQSTLLQQKDGSPEPAASEDRIKELVERMVRSGNLSHLPAPTPEDPALIVSI